MGTTTLGKSFVAPGFSNYIYDEASRFGVKVSIREAHQVTEHSHDNIQVSIPMSDTSVEVTWQRSNGLWSCAIAHQGDAIIIPPQQAHSVAWRKRAEFVNLHIEVAETSTDVRRFLDGIARAGETHVVKDSFLHAFGGNIITLISRGILFSSSFMSALRLIVVEHIINNYSSDLAQLRGDQLESSGLAAPFSEPQPTVGSARSPGSRAPKPKQAGKEKQPSAPGLAPWQLRKVLAFVSCDLKQDRSVAELADLVGLSMGHFSRAFRVSTGLSPHRWIIQERLKLAMNKLAYTDISIAAIARECGFAEQSHFTRSFTGAVGLSPAAWRRANKN